MRFLAIFVGALLVVSASGLERVAAQERDAVQTIAGILATVNHFPTDAQKETLQALAAESDTTVNEKVLITALLNMEHSVTADDKAKLDAIVEDDDAPASVKTIAGILSRFLHMASAADKTTLEKLAM